MAMQTHAMNMMAQAAPAKTTQRPPPASAAPRVIAKIATGNRYVHAGIHGFHFFTILTC